VTHKLAAPFDFSVRAGLRLAKVAYPKGRTHCIQKISLTGCMNRRKSRPCFTLTRCYDFLKYHLLCSQHFRLDCVAPSLSSISINVTDLVFERSTLNNLTYLTYIAIL
jgi:hypothetical protein